MPLISGVSDARKHARKHEQVIGHLNTLYILSGVKKVAALDQFGKPVKTQEVHTYFRVVLLQVLTNFVFFRVCSWTGHNVHFVLNNDMVFVFFCHREIPFFKQFMYRTFGYAGASFLAVNCASTGMRLSVYVPVCACV